MKLQSDFLAKTTNTPFNIEVEEAEGVYIFDKQGNKYFDFRVLKTSSYAAVH